MLNKINKNGGSRGVGTFNDEFNETNTATILEYSKASTAKANEIRRRTRRKLVDLTLTIAVEIVVFATIIAIAVVVIAR